MNRFSCNDTLCLPVFGAKEDCHRPPWSLKNAKPNPSQLFMIFVVAIAPYLNIAKSKKMWCKAPV